MENDQLVYRDSAPNTETVVKVLQPDKLFSESAKKDLKTGDCFEICPQANTFTQEICSLIELSRGAGLIIDYGEDHAFSDSFRGIKDHRLVKDWPTIIDMVGTLDLTAYVNFAQIQTIAKLNKQVVTHPPMP